jgi:RNA polymerase sigma factor (sigma-70 family)
MMDSRRDDEFVRHVEMDGGLAVTTWDDDAPVIGFQIGAFNWRLRRAREAKGWSRAELARQCGMFPGVVGDAEKLRRVSANAREKMALALGVPEDVLFPGEIDALPKDGPPQIELSLTREDVQSLSEPDAHQEMTEGAEREALRGQLVGAMETLSPRQQRIMRLRFGLDDGSLRTLDEVAHEFGVGRERIRQIEAQALRKLRHPSRTKGLRDYVPDYASSYHPKPDPTRCQRIENGQPCGVRFPLPGWMHAIPVPDLRQPMSWCDVCWTAFHHARARGRSAAS